MPGEINAARPRSHGERFVAVAAAVALVLASASGAPLVLALAASPAAAAPPGSGLADYVMRPDPALGWESRQTGRVRGARYRELSLTSQTWQGEPWRHQLFVVCPGNARGDRPGLLVIAGGDWRDRYLEPPDNPGPPAGTGRYRDLARRLAAPVAVLLQVPVQPLLGGLTEDALIAASFERYLAGAGDDWPLLLPMAKAGSAALTALTATAPGDCGVAPDRFVVSGASKRGWAAWLLAAADPRVAGLVPTVFDAVRLEAQLDHQREAWGGLSPMLGTYRAVLDRLATPAGDELLALVDPWRQRARLRMPKLIVLGTNDPYFPPDSSRLYLDGVAPANLLYLPNAGHAPADTRRIAAGIGALADAVAAAEPLPTVRLSADPSGPRLRVSIATDGRARGARVWVARSAVTAPRYERYVPQRARRRTDGSFRADVVLDGQYLAVFGEVDFRTGRRDYRLSSELLVLAPGGEPFPGP